jgi:hypothetical protein
MKALSIAPFLLGWSYYEMRLRWAEA